MKKRIFVYIALIMSGLMFSCTPESCLENTTSSLEAIFYSYTSKSVAAPDSLSISLIGKDTSVYTKVQGIKTAKLPLNPSAGSSSFSIRINGVDDTIIIFHNSYPHLISRECGYAFYHNIDSIMFTAGKMIDSISIINSTVTTLDEDNIHIFY
ncbi:MAG TPA: DUF6452 family protein [Bacteroidales bacterium]|nr:DUF6452 family protein [Bacteroidales bacterium]